MKADDLAWMIPVILSPKAPPSAWPIAQSLGAELLVNGDFSSGSSGAAPPSWTITGAGAGKTFTITDPTGGAGTGAARLVSDTQFVPNARQTILTIGDYYETVGVVSAWTSGNWSFQDVANGMIMSAAAAETQSLIARAANTAYLLQGFTAPMDFTIDSVSVKKITLNTQRSAPSANMRITALFTPPASPIKGDQVWIPVRISNWTTGDYLLAVYVYTGTRWDVQFYTVTAHSRSGNLGGATNVGTAIGMRVNCNGNSISVETLSGTTWTARGTTMTNANYNTATDFNVLARSTFTLGTLSRESAV